jgi:signal transduction histidine kinase
MLHQFLDASRDKIIARARAKVANRPAPRPTEAELENGVPMFLTQLVGMLQAPRESGTAAIGTSAAKHGDELLRMGFTVGQVVHDYGGLCQAITEIAVEDNVSITSSEFKTLNGCLDDAIASAVSEFGHQREQSVSDEAVEHLGVLTHELRNELTAAMYSFEVIQKGTVGASGSTGALLARTLDRMREIIDRSLVEVRLKAGTQLQTQVVSVPMLIEELAITAELEAQRRGRHLTVEPVALDVRIEGDPHLLISALTNLLQNALKFTTPHGHVSLRTFATADRVRIEIEDECGGLPEGKVEDLFRVFEKRGTDRSGLGLGLAISRQAIEANRGTIEVRDLPGQGCIFTVDLPRHTPAQDVPPRADQTTRPGHRRSGGPLGTV